MQNHRSGCEIELVECSKNPDFLEYVDVFSDVITAPKLQSCLNAYDLTTSFLNNSRGADISVPRVIG